nr:MAG TPA: cathepsin L [Caudoviricetes sp.]
MDFRNLPAVKSWGERGYFLLSLKIQPHTPF